MTTEDEYIDRIRRLRLQVRSMRETLNATIELPNGFYERRSELYDQLAASVLICPEKCPTEKRLPRRMLTDEPAMVIMHLARSGRSSEQIALIASRKVAPWYVDYLLTIISDPHRCPFVCHVDWCANKIRKMEAVYSRHIVLLHDLIRVRKASDNF